MKLSIIVPVYNVKDYLIRCLESIREQTYNDYEVRIVDDGSTDGSGEIVERYCQGKEKFKVYHKPNGGLMSAWMEGINHASGQYIGFVDSDDYVHPQMYEKLLVKAFENDCDIVMCDRYDIIGETTKIGKSCVQPGLYCGKMMDEIYQKTLPTFGGVHITNARWNKIFKHELFLSNTKYCNHLSRICEDRFITPACMFSASSFYYIDEPLYYYVFREGSNHSKASEKLQDTMELLYSTQKQMLKDKGMYEKYGEFVERANLNYLRLMILRNFSGPGDKTIRKKMATRILTSKLYARCVREYGKDLYGKLGLVVRILFRIKSSSLFVFACQYVGY